MRTIPRPTTVELFGTAWKMFIRSALVLIAWLLLGFFIIFIPVTFAVGIGLVSTGHIDATRVGDISDVPRGVLIGAIVTALLVMACVMPFGYNAIMRGMQHTVKFAEVPTMPGRAYRTLVLWQLIFGSLSAIPTALLQSQPELNYLSPAGGLMLAVFLAAPFFSYGAFGIAAGHFNSVGQSLTWNLQSQAVRVNYFWLIVLSALCSLLNGVAANLFLVGVLITAPLTMFVNGIVYAYLAQFDAQSIADRPNT